MNDLNAIARDVFPFTVFWERDFYGAAADRLLRSAGLNAMIAVNSAGLFSAVVLLTVVLLAGRTMRTLQRTLMLYLRFTYHDGRERKQSLSAPAFTFQ